MTRAVVLMRIPALREAPLSFRLNSIMSAAAESAPLLACVLTKKVFRHRQPRTYLLASVAFVGISRVILITVVASRDARSL